MFVFWPFALIPDQGKYPKSKYRENYKKNKNNKNQKYKKRKQRQYINETSPGNTLEVNIKKKIYLEDNKTLINNEIFLQNETNKVYQSIFINNNELEKMKLNSLENNKDKINKELTNINSYSNILN